MTMLDSLPQQKRPSRRVRPSLAALADSGYEPSRPPSAQSTATTVPRSFARSSATVAVGPHAVSAAFDVGVASQLLGDDSLLRDPFVTQRTRAGSQTIRSMRSMRSMRSFPFAIDGESGGSATVSKATTYVHTASVSRAGTITRSATISSAWSGVSNRLFTESAVGVGNERQANSFTEQFDKLAKKHGIQPFPSDYKGEPTSVSVSSVSPEHSSGDSTPALPGSRFWNKLLRRSPSTVDISKQHGNMKMSLTKKRNISISDLAAIGKGKRDSLKGMHLEDMIRLGGVAIFSLPLGLGPGDLLIPTCIHAAATFILNNALKAPGLFRVSGNVNTTFALYDYYQRQLEENNNESVVATTALARLPSHIHYTVHDVAHLFKKLLHGLPGGLLGSPAVFQALYNVHSFVYPDPTAEDHIKRKVKPRMIALALASINLHFRISLICAVFGLLRAINLASDVETESKIRDPHETFAAMKEDALGIVFGPLLLGDKSEHILCEELNDRGGLLVLPKVDPAGNLTLRDKRGKTKGNPRLDPGYSKRQLERTKRAAMVCQMLIDHWEDICYQLKRINALDVTAQAYDLPGQTQADGYNYVQEGEARKLDNMGLESRAGTQRGTTRSRRGSQETIKPEHHHSLHLHGHSISKHLPHTHGRQIHKRGHVEDLLKFHEHEQSKKQEVAAPTPLVSERPDRKQFLGMTPVPELQTPGETPIQSPTRQSFDTPNWLAPGPEKTLEKESTMSTPNWRVLDPEKTPGKESMLSTPNWRTLDPEKTPRGSLLSTPNWMAHEKTPGKESTMSTPNWRVIDPEKTPAKESMMSTPNWRAVPTLPTPAEEPATGSPNWRVIDPNETEDPQTPTKANMATRPRPLDLSSISTPASIYPHSSGTSSGAPTPPLEVVAEAALRYRSLPRRLSVDEVIIEGDLSLTAPAELDTVPEMESDRRNTISPIPELTRALRDVVSDPEDIGRASTLPALSRIKSARPPPSFSIFEDEPEKTPRATRQQLPQSPDLTLTRPGSRASVKLKPKGLQSSPTRLPPESPTRRGSIPLQPATPNRRPRTGVDSDFEDKYLSKEVEDSPSKKQGNSALYAEIRRLQRLVDAKTEEANSTRKELELAKSMAQAGTMSHLLREAQEEVKVWRNRAQWAEKQLRAQHIATAEQDASTSSRGERRRYSVD